MPLNINDIKPRTGTFTCNLWENTHTKLPLSLFYAIEIPLEPFDSGHTYTEQPTETSIIIEWMNFNAGHQNEPNWKNLTGNSYKLSYEENTAEGSIYLGSEHCQFNSTIRFLSLTGTTFEIELTLAVDFNIETINLDKNGQFTLRTHVNFDGLLLYDKDSLPSIAKIKDPMTMLSKFIDLSVYQPALTAHDNEYVQWRQLKPKP